jgi:periplasmic divalent cation tolerance protein
VGSAREGFVVVVRKPSLETDNAKLGTGFPRMTDCLLILVTAGSETEAETIAKTLVEERLVACVNIVNPIRSIYRWEGKIADDREWLLIMKTRAARFAAVEARVKVLHSYQVPEVIAVPIQVGAEAYLQWIRKETVEGEGNS